MLRLYSLLVVEFEIELFHQEVNEEPISQILVAHQGLRRLQLTPLPVDGGFRCAKTVQP